MHPQTSSSINRQLWRRYTLLAAPYWRSDARWRARGLLALLVVLLLCQTGFNVAFNHETGEFTSALASGDAERFWASIRRFVAILLFAVLIYACYYFVRDNPDQRIAEDVNSYTQQSLYFLMVVLG